MGQVWLTSKEAAEYLGISVPALKQRVYRRQLPAYKLGASTRFLRAELDEIIKAAKVAELEIRLIQKTIWAGKKSN